MRAWLVVVAMIAMVGSAKLFAVLGERCGCQPPEAVTRGMLDETSMRLAWDAITEHRCPSIPAELHDHRVDGWGRDLRMQCDRRSLVITVVSAGSDGLFDTRDDLMKRR